MKKAIHVFDYAEPIAKAVENGVLLTAQADGRVNSMTISWGMLGIQWNKPLFIVFVRDSRFTKKLLDANPEFTINVPMNKIDPKILSFCGTQSGRTVDKAKALGLTLEPAISVTVPGIKELPLTLECKIIYRQRQDEAELSETEKKRFYPLLANGKRDIHTAYYGEIVNAYIIS